jgi:hypothetical protein
VFAHVSQLRVRLSAERLRDEVRSVIGIAGGRFGGRRAEPRAVSVITPVGPRWHPNRSAAT